METTPTISPIYKVFRIAEARGPSDEPKVILIETNREEYSEKAYAIKYIEEQIEEKNNSPFTIIEIYKRK